MRTLIVEGLMLISIIFFFVLIMVMSGVIGDMIEDGTFKHGLFRLSKFLRQLWRTIVNFFDSLFL